MSDEFKFFNKTCPANALVSWEVLDKDDILIGKYDNDACFSPITYSQIPANAAFIEVNHSLSKIPYTKEYIKKWIDVLNELGFFCTVKLASANAYFLIDLAKFDRKMMVSCTLSLIRTLYEVKICIAPDYFFEQLENNPNLDKFLLIQDSLKQLKIYHSNNVENKWNKYCETLGSPNSNHMVTYYGNGVYASAGTNISKENFFKNIKNTNFKVYDDGKTNLSSLWDGSRFLDDKLMFITIPPVLKDKIVEKV